MSVLARTLDTFLKQSSKNYVNTRFSLAECPRTFGAFFACKMSFVLAFFGLIFKAKVRLRHLMAVGEHGIHIFFYESKKEFL